ncbi:hypothetical protein LMG24076_02805 [Trinickia soli]|nr:hypothetical protein LMG24076_02805 [Trinickia soli]
MKADCCGRFVEMHSNKSREIKGMSDFMIPLRLAMIPGEIRGIRSWALRAGREAIPTSPVVADRPIA